MVVAFFGRIFLETNIFCLQRNHISLAQKIIRHSNFNMLNIAYHTQLCTIFVLVSPTNYFGLSNIIELHFLSKIFLNPNIFSDPKNISCSNNIYSYKFFLLIQKNFFGPKFLVSYFQIFSHPSCFGLKNFNQNFLKQNIYTQFIFVPPNLTNFLKQNYTIFTNSFFHPIFLCPTFLCHTRLHLGFSA